MSPESHTIAAIRSFCVAPAPTSTHTARPGPFLPSLPTLFPAGVLPHLHGPLSLALLRFLPLLANIQLSFALSCCARACSSHSFLLCSCAARQLFPFIFSVQRSCFLCSPTFFFARWTDLDPRAIPDRQRSNLWQSGISRRRSRGRGRADRRPRCRWPERAAGSRGRRAV